LSINIFDRKKIYLLPVLFFLLAVSCEFAFDPLEENNKYHYSIYGYLDASADTQWVRVMPVRDSLLATPGSFDVKVVLEDLTTGNSVTLKDSLFGYVQGTTAHNFWTTMKLNPNGIYRLVAEGSGGKMSSVTVELPADYPTPRVRIADTALTDEHDRVYIEGVNQLVDVATVYYYENSEEDMRSSYFSIPHLQDSSRTTTGGYLVIIDPYEEADEVNERMPHGARVEHKQIFVASADPEFNALFKEWDDRIKFPNGISNVKNGVGYVAGIVSKTIPYKSCYDENDYLVPCPLEPSPW
jgi:hypothetical protein